MKTLHRILTPVFALLALPAAYFLPMFRILITGSLSTNDDGTKTNYLTTLTGIGEYTSFSDIVKLIRSGSSKLSTIKELLSSLGDGESKLDLASIVPTYKYLYAAGIVLVITLILAIVLAVFAAATKKYTVCVLMAAGGIILSRVTNMLFDAFAKPFLNGGVNLSSLLGGSDGASVLSSLVTSLASVDYLQLSVAITAVLFAFVGAAIFSLCAACEQKTKS